MTWHCIAQASREPELCAYSNTEACITTLKVGSAHDVPPKEATAAAGKVGGPATTPSVRYEMLNVTSGPASSTKSTDVKPASGYGPLFALLVAWVLWTAVYCACLRPLIVTRSSS